MMIPLDPRTVYAIHQEKVQKLERDIALARAVAERRAAGSSFEPQPAWYVRAGQWIQAKLSFGRHASQPAVEAVVAQKPCTDSPC